MSSSTRSRLAQALGAACVLGAGLALLAQCRTSGAQDPRNARAFAAWSVVYEVLQHPRCLNCHPAGDVPLQGDDSTPHGQNVQRGADGLGLYAMRCATCHQTQNGPDAHLPPGAPGWHLPTARMPLVFQGLSPGDLCRQMKDPARNGGRQPEQLLRHVTDDALVLWGWDPGVGRTPVPVPHSALVSAMKTWIDAGCGCPD